MTSPAGTVFRSCWRWYRPTRPTPRSAQSFLGREEAKGGYYTDILDGIAAHGVDPARQMEELHNRLMFTILVSNTDDHLKNHGFLYEGDGRWVLAPAFDINPQPERHRTLKTGISEEYGRAASIGRRSRRPPGST